jgi:hypothetical protein
VDAKAIAKWAEKQTAPAHTPKYQRLTDDARIAILKLHKLGKTQVEIAQALNCDQSSVSRWLSMCQDSTAEANTYLRGSALRMARNIVQRGLARDHIAALNGLEVLANTEGRTLNVIINGLHLHGTGRDSVVEGEVLSPPPSEGAGEGQ